MYASGKIQGTVNPSDIQVLASVTVDGGEISADTDDNGVFVLNGVPAGTYTVVLTPDSNSDYIETIVENVVVVNGVITDIGIIDLEPKIGSITGTITNVGVVVTASVMVGGDTVSVNIDENRVFLLENIPIGIYTVTLTPADGSGLAVKEESDVEVTQDTVTDLGEITLE